MKALLPLALMVAVAGAPGAASAKTLVSFAQSGGLAAVSMTVTVTTTGRVAVDGAGGNDRSQRLRTATLRHLRELLSAARWDRANPGRSHCADCFEYVVRYHGRRARYDDSQAKQVPRSVRAVVAELRRISRGGR
jgi:hypothetical protein